MSSSASSSGSGSDAEDGEGVAYVSPIPGVPLRIGNEDRWKPRSI